MAYNGINFNRARMPARQGIIDPSRMGPPQMAVDGGSMRQGIVNAPTMREALMQQSGPQRSVVEILSEPLGEMTPDFGGATSAASRQRQIADMLLQGAQQQDNTSIAGGLSQLGQAFLARRAGQKADAAEDKQREMASLLLQQAMGEGPESQAARAQLFADSPAALVAQSDAARRQAVEDTRYVDERDYLRGRHATEDTRYVDERDYLRGRDETADERADRLEAEETRRFNATYGLDERSVAAAEAAAALSSSQGSRLLTPEEVSAAGYPEGAVVQTDANGNHNVRYKPEAEFTAGQKNKYINDAAQLEAYQATLDEYLGLVDTVGLKKIYRPDDPDVAKLEAMQQSLSFGAKDLFQLGVLSKDDYEAINRIIPDATGFEALLKNKDSFMASAQPLEDYIERAYNAVPEQFRNRGQAETADAGPPAAPAPAGPGNLPTVTDLATYEAVPPGGYYVGPDGQTRQKPHFLPIGGK